MRDTINRYETIKELDKIRKTLSNGEKAVVEQAMRLVERMPECGAVTVEDAVDRLRATGWLEKHYGKRNPERKTGRWILHENQRQEDVDNGNYLYICSECGKSDIHAKTQKVPFCWWCGAKMEVDERDEL